MSTDAGLLDPLFIRWEPNGKKCGESELTMAKIKRVVSPKGKVVYRVRYRVHGLPEQNKTFASEGLARTYIATLEAIHGTIAKNTTEDLGRVNTPTRPKKTQRSLLQAIKRYSDEILTEKKHSTVINQALQLSVWAEYLGDVPVQEIARQDIQDAFYRIKSERQGKKGKPLSGSTANRYYAVFSHLMNTLVDWEWIETNPMKRIKRYKEAEPISRFLSDDERARLLAACKQSRCKVLYDIVFLLLSTGCRKDEILSLTWDAIDLENEVIYLRSTKTGKPRMLAITGEALSILKRLHALSDRSGLLFPAPRRKDKPYYIDTAWCNALKRAKIPDFTLHCLRHTTASYMAQNGVRLHTISKVLGHANIAMTMRYSHLVDDGQREALAAVTAKL